MWLQNGVFQQRKKDRRKKIVRYLGILIFALLIPSLVKSPYYIRILNIIILYSILCLGLNLILGFIGIFSFGHAAYYGIGAYTTAILMTRYQTPFIYAFIASGIFAFIFGLLTGLPAARIRGDYFCLVTLSFGEVFRLIMQAWVSFTGGQPGIAGIPIPKVLFYSIRTGSDFYYLGLCLLLFTYISMTILTQSKFGRAWMAIREDELAASLMGINAPYFKVIGFAIGCFYAGLAGSYFAVYFSAISPSNFTLAESCLMVVMVIVGGIGSPLGSIIGAATMVLATEAFRPLYEYRLLIIGCIMIGVLIFCPRGITGFFKREKT